jgi:hypothetical protein
VLKSYGCNAERLTKAKRHYDPDNIFYSAFRCRSAKGQWPRIESLRHITPTNDVVAIIKNWQAAGWDSLSQLA